MTPSVSRSPRGNDELADRESPSRLASPTSTNESRRQSRDKSFCVGAQSPGSPIAPRPPDVSSGFDQSRRHRQAICQPTRLVVPHASVVRVRMMSPRKSQPVFHNDRTENYLETTPAARRGRVEIDYEAFGELPHASSVHRFFENDDQMKTAPSHRNQITVDQGRLLWSSSNHALAATKFPSAVTETPSRRANQCRSQSSEPSRRSPSYELRALHPPCES